MSFRAPLGAEKLKEILVLLNFYFGVVFLVSYPVVIYQLYTVKSFKVAHQYFK